MTMLYDLFGRPIETGLTKRPETREIAVAQLRDRWSTYPSKGLTPGRLAEILAQADAGEVLRQAELFEEMEEKDAHLASQFSIRKQAVTGVEYEILPNKADRKGEEVATFCAEALERLPNLDENLEDALDALAKGYSLHEILWETSSGQSMVRGLDWIHPKKLTFWNSLIPRVFTEEEPINGAELQPFKWVYHRHKARSGYDTRAGIMRTCTWMYLFKNYTIKDWVTFSETYGQPLRIGKYSPSASEPDKEALLMAVRAIGVEAAGIISKNTEIEFIEAARTSSLNIYEALANFCDAQMSKAILGQTLTSEAGGSKGQGSKALGKVHNEVRLDLVRHDAKALAKTLTQQLLVPLVGFNFGWDRPVPQFRFQVQEPEDLQALAEVYSVFIDRGMAVSQEHVSERFGIPLMDGQGGKETPFPGKALAPPPGEVDNPAPGQKQPTEAELRLKSVRAADVGNAAGDPTGAPTVALLTAQLASGVGGQAMDAMTQTIQAILDDCFAQGGTLEDFRDRLLEALGPMDPRAMATALAEAMLVADLAGRYDGGEGNGGQR